jgi:aminoglycoside phosphotransferase (APT) family kinase protein
MTQSVELFLHRHAEAFSIGRQLHGVPPHVVHEVEFDGRRAVCKVSTGSRSDAGIEGRVQRRVGQETSVPVPEVLAVGADGYVAAYHEEAPGEEEYADSILTEAWLRAAGRTLARLYEEATFDRHGLLAVDGDPADPGAGLRVDSPPDATWSDALDDLLGVYQASVRGTGYAPVIAEARQFLDEYADRFDAHGGPALLHGWFTPEHASVRDGRTRCVLDFEHALVGSPAWDYWRTAVPLFLGDGWDHDDGAATFRTAYESVRSLPFDVAASRAAYVPFISVSYLDSLHTQRGIDEETRDQADRFASRIRDSIDAARAALSE